MLYKRDMSNIPMCYLGNIIYFCKWLSTLGNLHPMKLKLAIRYNFPMSFIIWATYEPLVGCSIWFLLVTFRQLNMT